MNNDLGMCFYCWDFDRIRKELASEEAEFLCDFVNLRDRIYTTYTLKKKACLLWAMKSSG